MKMNKKKAGIAGALAVLLTGTALAAGGTLKREGVKVQSYESLDEAGYCTVLVYMDGSDLESDYGMGDSDLKDYKLTLSLINVNAYENFHNIFHKLMSNLNEKLSEEEYQKLGQQRSMFLGFGSRSESSVPEQVDMMDLCKMMASLDINMKAADDEVTVSSLEKAYSDLVVYSVSKGYSALPCGLSLYIPSPDNEWFINDMKVYDNLNFCEEYRKLMVDYKTYLMKEDEIEWREPSIEDNYIWLTMDSDDADNIADAYLATYKSEEDGTVYLLSADGDVILNRSGYLKAKTESVFWGLKGQPISMIESIDSEYQTEYISPILYKRKGGEWEQCNMYILFSDDVPDGEITSITSVEVDKQIYELGEGDELIPLYPLYQFDEGISLKKEDEQKPADSDIGIMEKSEGKIFDRSYYMGNVIDIKSLEAGDGDLEKISIIDKEQLKYGFMIRDTKMNMYYTDIIEK